MKVFISKSPYLITFFILLLIRPFLYGLLIPKKEIVINEITLNNDEVISSDKYVYGTLIYQNPYKYNEEFVIAIDDSLVKINDYVINEKGLLGIISKKYQNMAIVKMLTSKDLVLQIMVNNCYGLLKNGLITNIDAHCKVSTGDTIYTSNLGYVDEIVKIGTISKVIKDSNHISDSFEIIFFNNEVIPKKVMVIRGQK